MGVDFVPAYRTYSVESETNTLDHAPAMPASFIEAKPLPPAEPTGEASSVPKPMAASAQGSTTVKFERSPRTTKEDDRAYKARLLDDLRARYEKDAPHKQFVTAHTRIVFGDGDPAARLVFVGEAPGAEEDKQGIPFCGRSGDLLNKMIVAMGLSREVVYICNVLKTRPPDNATPTAREAAICEPYLQEQLAIIAPEVIVTLGLPAVRTLLKTEDTMTRLRGRWASITLVGGRRVPVMPTYHPAYLLRAYTPENRQKVWSDLQMVMQKLEEQPRP